MWHELVCVQVKAWIYGPNRFSTKTEKQPVENNLYLLLFNDISNILCAEFIVHVCHAIRYHFKCSHFYFGLHMYLATVHRLLAMSVVHTINVYLLLPLSTFIDPNDFYDTTF